MTRPRRRYVVRSPAAAAAETPGQRELLAVREVAHAFLHADRPEEALQFAIDRVAPVVGAALASVYLVDGASELMRLVAAHNWPERLRPWLADVRVRLGFGPSGEAASERRVIEVPDVFADPDLEDWQEVARELGFAAIVALPVQSATQALGAVTFYFRAWDDFTPERRGLLRLVADLMAAAGEKAALLDRVRRAEAAAADAHAELEQQLMMATGLRASRADFVAAAIASLREALARTAESPGAAPEALRLVADLEFIVAVETGTATATASLFDPRLPLREAMHEASVRFPNANFVAEEPIHVTGALRSDVEKLGAALARLLARDLEPTGERHATLAARAGRVEYRMAGRRGADMAWRFAAATAQLLGARLEVEDTPAGSMVVLSLPMADERKGG